MAKDTAAQAAQATQENGAAAKVAGPGPQQPETAPAAAMPGAAGPMAMVVGLGDQPTPLQRRALEDNDGSLAREFALGAARLCESPQVLPKTKERARRLLRLAIASLE